MVLGEEDVTKRRAYTKKDEKFLNGRYYTSKVSW